MTAPTPGCGSEGVSDCPIITTLCGSTRFPDAFALANMHLSMLGRIVLSVGMCAHADQPTGSRFLANDGDESAPEKQRLDQLHFRKIDISDGIFVVNPGNYVGSSTKREIAYAQSLGKTVEWMFPDLAPLRTDRSRAHKCRSAEGSAMTQSSKHHRTTGQDIVFTFWLAFSQNGDVKLTKGSPLLAPDQRGMQVEARLPKALWNIPSLSAEIVVPDPGQPNAINARIEQFAEQLKTAVGCDVVLTVKPAEQEP